MIENSPTGARLQQALTAQEPSVRLQAAMAAGMRPHPEQVDVLVERCAVEPDFFVRDMLTWALIRHDKTTTVDRVVAELTSDVAQARSQALHTLSKLGVPHTWSAMTTELLTDPDDEVARTAWRTATGLVPDGGEPELVRTLATQLGRGDRDVQRSLSRAFVALGEAAVPVIEEAVAAVDRGEGARTHAAATVRLLQNPDEGFDAAVSEAQRLVALRSAPTIVE